MRIAICDNDSEFRSQIELLIASWAEERADVTVESFANAKRLLNACRRIAFDIIILDTVLRPLNGIEVAREVREIDKDVKLVFLASSDDLALESYTVKASNYLLKSGDPEVLLRCLEELESDMQVLSPFVTFRGVHALYRKRVSSIEYLKARRRFVEVTLTSGETIVSNEPFHSFEEKLRSEDRFYKCYRGCMVNLNNAAFYSAGKIVMSSGQEITVSRSLKADVIQLFKSAGKYKR